MFFDGFLLHLTWRQVSSWFRMCQHSNHENSRHYIITYAPPPSSTLL